MLVIIHIIHMPRAIKDSDTIGELKHHLKLHFPRYVDDFYLT